MNGSLAQNPGLEQRLPNDRSGWSAPSADPRIAALYTKGKLQQWNAETDLDWDVPSNFGAPLSSPSPFAATAFDGSALAKYGRPLWDQFRWEFQAWLVSQFLPGEEAALNCAARLVQVVPDQDMRYCLASQVSDEARHMEAFSRYLREKVPAPYPVSGPLASLLANTLHDSHWDVTVLGMQIMVEAFAMATFRLADRTFHDDLIRRICLLAAQDEARHVSLGVLSLRTLYREMASSELRYREEFVLEAIYLMSRRFELEEIWDRLGIDRNEGTTFAKTNEVMTKYRQAISAGVVSSLAAIGLVTDRIAERLTALNLLGAAGLRAVTKRR